MGFEDANDQTFLYIAAVQNFARILFLFISDYIHHQTFKFQFLGKHMARVDNQYKVTKQCFIFLLAKQIHSN
jgi:hypothetical protein